MNDKPLYMDDGGPVYPSQPLGRDGLPEHSFEWGMSLRDYFAAAALQGILARETRQRRSDMLDGTLGFKAVSIAAYAAAEAMLAERGKK